MKKRKRSPRRSAKTARQPMAKRTQREKQQKPRGKAKPLPIEAARLAFVVKRVQSGDGVFIADGDRLLPGKEWAEQMFWKTAGAKSATVTDADKELRRIKRSDSEALRVLATHWRQWNAEGLKWGERALSMANDHGFPDFRNMSRTTFDRWRERAAKLYLADMGATQKSANVRHLSR